MMPKDTCRIKKDVRKIASNCNISDLSTSHKMDIMFSLLVGFFLTLISPSFFCSVVFCLDDVQNCTRSLLKLVSGWLPRHVIGAVLVSLPAVSIFSHLAYSVQLPIQVSRTKGR